MSKLAEAWQHIRENWKTSLSGLLTGLIGFSAVASTPNPWISSALGIKILGAASISKVILGLIQKDGTTIQTSKE